MIFSESVLTGADIASSAGSVVGIGAVGNVVDDRNGVNDSFQGVTDPSAITPRSVDALIERTLFDKKLGFAPTGHVYNQLVSKIQVPTSDLE